MKLIKILFFCACFTVCSVWAETTGLVQFSTEGYEKSKGLGVLINYPEKWMKTEAKGPHIVQVLKEKDDNSDTSTQCLIMIRGDAPFADSTEWKEVIESPEFDYGDFLPKNSKLLFAQKRTYDNEPGVLLEYTAETEYRGVKILQHIMSHNVFYKNYGISVQCAVGGMQYTDREITSKFKKFYNIFKDIGDSIIINKTSVNTSNNDGVIPQQTDASRQNNYSNNLVDDLISPYTNKTIVLIELIVAILFTWGLGLLIPWVIRYKVVKKPLKEFPAWITAITQGILMIIISEAMGNHGKHFALVLVMLVAHSILTRKKASKNGKKISSLLLFALMVFFHTNPSYSITVVTSKDIVNVNIPRALKRFGDDIKVEHVYTLGLDWKICDEDVFCEHEDNVISIKTSEPVTGVVVKLETDNYSVNRKKYVVWKCDYIDGKRNGLCKEYSGERVRSITHYVDGIKEGPFKQYKSRGTYAEGTYVNGQIEGHLKTFYSDGSIYIDSTYKDGFPIKMKTYSEDGKLRSTLNEKEIRKVLSGKGL